MAPKETSFCPKNFTYDNILSYITNIKSLVPLVVKYDCYCYTYAPCYIYNLLNTTHKELQIY